MIGCELAHILKKGGNDVTLLARGKWKDTLEKRGLVIRHYLQRKTTTDEVKVTGCHVCDVQNTVGAAGGNRPLCPCGQRDVLS
ncbi:MAG: hypothetical protein NC251_09355 [Lachnoclostridium sp.]|nr:hypothetical protein [Lachnospira sp.]MCM1248624.1 hypothetical protein [Lachnoclostridium sp.]